MATSVISSPIEYIEKLGKLHDVRIERVLVDIESDTLCLTVEDLNAVFSDLPEYPGKKRCSLIFNEIRNVSVDITTFDGVRISNFEIERHDALWSGDFFLNDGGGVRSWGNNHSSIQLVFRELHIEDLPEI